MKFFIKQLVGVLATPLTFALLIIAIASAFRIFGRRCAAMRLVVIAAAIAYLGSLPPVGDALLVSLEKRYPALGDNASLPSITAIVVLGSGYSPHDDIPVTGALDEDGLARIVEGVRLALRYPSAKLVVSGGAAVGLVPSAHGYAKLARELRIPNSSIVVLDTPLDTGDEARAISKLLGVSPFLLVTSAYHMPRAMRLMQRAGVHPIPAPTGQRVDVQTPAWRYLIPSAAALRKTDRALHEYLGLAALALGQD